MPPLMGLALAKQVKKVLDSPCNGRTRMNSELLATDQISEKVEEAINILRHVGIPVRDFTKRRQERMAKALLAVGHIEPAMSWSEAASFYTGTAKPVTTREIIRFWNTHYGEKIADSSYDDVRRKDLVYLVEAGLVSRSAANPAADTNDGTRGYAIPEEVLALLHSYGSSNGKINFCLFDRKLAV